MVGSLDEAARDSRRFADMLDDEKRAVDAWLVGALELRPGDLILETACGTAGTGQAIAAALGAQGRVICSDSSEPMLAAAREVAARRGIATIELRRMDAERLALADRSVDGVVCRLGFQVMDDPAAACREAYRVLRPGRRLALGVWAEPERNPWKAIPEQVLGLTRAPGASPGPFALADPALLRRLLDDAGFADVRLERVRADQRYSDPEHFWATCTGKSRMIRAGLRRLDQEQQARAKRTILERVTEHRLAAPGLTLPAEMLMAVGTRPGLP